MKKTTYVKIRLTFLTISTILFPVTFYYLSPMVPMNASIQGVVSGSLIVFLILLVLSIFFGRFFCSWLCPAGGIQDQLLQSRNKRVSVKKISWLKYVIWFFWLGTLLFLFRKAGGVKEIDFTYATVKGFSTADLMAIIVYTIVVLSFTTISLIFGRRTACHTICWISPFMIIGKKLAETLKIPNLHLRAAADQCVHCGKCDTSCPMSLDVEKLVDMGVIRDNNCILCGECKESCPKKLFSWKFGVIK